VIEPTRARRVVSSVLCLILPLTLLACAAPTAHEVQEELPQIDLRSIQGALRDGKPGERTFDVAVKHLPRLILDKSSWHVAAGAFVVGQHELEDYVPHLLEALERKNQRDPLRAKRAILDTLLRLDAEVPANLLATEELEAELGAVTYLLLVRDFKANAKALRRLHDVLPTDNAARWASACALTNQRDPYIAERLLAATPWRVQLIVEDPDNEAFGDITGGDGRWMTSHGSWPPRVTYHLDLPNAEGRLFPIKYQREESLKSGKHQKKVYGHLARKLRVRLLDELLAKSRIAGKLDRDESIHVVWTDEETYKKDVKASFSRFRMLLKGVAQTLEKAGLLSRYGDVIHAIRFSVRIHDKRMESAGSLPAPPKISGVTYE